MVRSVQENRRVRVGKRVQSSGIDPPAGNVSVVTIVVPGDGEYIGHVVGSGHGYLYHQRRTPLVDADLPGHRVRHRVRHQPDELRWKQDNPPGDPDRGRVWVRPDRHSRSRQVERVEARRRRAPRVYKHNLQMESVRTGRDLAGNVDREAAAAVDDDARCDWDWAIVTKNTVVGHVRGYHTPYYGAMYHVQNNVTREGW